MSKQERSRITLCSHRSLTCNKLLLDPMLTQWVRSPEHSIPLLDNEDDGTIWGCAWSVELMIS